MEGILDVSYRLCLVWKSLNRSALLVWVFLVSKKGGKVSCQLAKRESSASSSKAKYHTVPAVYICTKMVICKSNKFKEIYQMIKDDAVGGGTTLLMLVATDCDSLCACKIFSVCLCH